jgi:hypothetical protein
LLFLAGYHSRMGLEVLAPDAPVDEVLRSLELSLAMIDGQLCLPDAAIPPGWKELRVRTPAGMVTLARRPDGIALLVFGNAGPELVSAQRRIADALTQYHGPRP